MSDMREKTFVLLVMLVTVSAVYEWAATAEPIGAGLGIEGVETYSASRLTNILDNIEILSGNSADTSQQSNPAIFVGAIIDIGADLVGLVANLFFGWVALLNGIFDAIGFNEVFTMIFALPIAMVEVIGIAYLLIDLKKAIPFL